MSSNPALEIKGHFGQGKVREKKEMKSFLKGPRAHLRGSEYSLRRRIQDVLGSSLERGIK